jgi:hypothetical protein
MPSGWAESDDSEINVINTGGLQDDAHYIVQKSSFTPPFNSRFRFVTTNNPILTGTPMLIAARSASTPQTDAGGTIPFSTLAKSVCTVSNRAGGGNFQDQIGHGFLTTPEPASIAMLGAALSRLHPPSGITHAFGFASSGSRFHPATSATHAGTLMPGRNWHSLAAR